MGYTDVFGGGAIYPSDVSYLALALDADVSLAWPLEASGAPYPAARVIDVTPDSSAHSIILPDASQTGPGQTILFNNLSGSESFLVKDADGGTLATVDFGEQWQVYLASNASEAGTWRVFRYGASTATVQPSSLAGFGLTTTGSTLSQAAPVTTFSTSPLAAAASMRAGLLVWTGTGSGTIDLPTASTVGNNFFVLVRNAGGGNLTVDPSGGELINAATTLTLNPGDSAVVVTDGTVWYTVGFGQDAVFAFDYTAIALTGGTYTLAGSELNRIAYKFTGALTSNVIVEIPATIQQYWINNATTGAFTLGIKTAAGATTFVNQGAKGIYYCDGLNVVLASDPTTLTVPIVVSDGGTGATTASAARLNLGITAFADAIVTATTGATVRTTIDAAKSGANSDITSLTGLTTPISVAQGGTGLTTYVANGVLYASGAGSLDNSALLTWNGSTFGVTGAATISGAVTGLSFAVAADASLAMSGSNPILNWDANDYYYYDRAGNAHNFAIGSATRLSVTSAGAAVTGALTTTGAVTATGAVTGSAGLFRDAEAYFNLSGSNPILNFDNNDYLLYNRTSNTLSAVIGGTTQVVFASGNADFVGNVTAPTHKVDATYYMSTIDPTTPLLNFDANDYMSFNRSLNTFGVYIGGALSLHWNSTAPFFGGQAIAFDGMSRGSCRLYDSTSAPSGGSNGDFWFQYV